MPGIINSVTSESSEGQLDVERPTKPLRLVVVSGMSGAGRSTAAHSLEDLRAAKRLKFAALEGNRVGWQSLRVDPARRIH